MWLDYLSSKPKLRLLRYLVHHNGMFTGRQLALAAGVQPKLARAALSDLVRGGLVRERKAGRAFLYTLNRQHYAVSGVLAPAFKRETEWLEVLARRLITVAPGMIRSVVLYGSWARGEAGSESDVDLLVVVSDSARKDLLERRLDTFRLEAVDRFGVPVSLLMMTPSELAGSSKMQSRFLRDILEQGRVLAGRPLSQVVRSA